MSSMRGIDTPVRQRRRRVFKEVANLAYNSTNLKDDMEALPYKTMKSRSSGRAFIVTERSSVSASVWPWG